MIRLLSLAIGIAGSMWAQTVATPRFEVAAIKPTPVDQQNGNSNGKSGKGRYNYTNVTLKRCIMGAFGLGPNQILGGPPWLDNDRYDIVAKAEQPVDDDDLLNRMMQNLLADRFKLIFHRESRMTPAYVLEVVKGGPKLEAAPDGESSTNWSRGTIDAKVTTMAHFAEVLSRVLDFPVVNQTGLDGAFNLTVKWIPESKDGAASDLGPTLFTALQQFGLRLTSHRTPVEFFVIDHVERPTEN